MGALEHSICSVQYGKILNPHLLWKYSREYILYIYIYILYILYIYIYIIYNISNVVHIIHTVSFERATPFVKRVQLNPNFLLLRYFLFHELRNKVQ